MDLKSKFWAGKIYQQFESLCQDFDDLINKDSVKSVENQMQNVGISVKKFYSNVVQDILPVPGDVARTKSQSMDGKKIDTSDDLSSTTDIKNSDASLPIEVEHVTQSIEPPYEDSSQEADTYSCSTQDDDDDAMIWKAVEDNVTLDPPPVTSVVNSESEIFIGTFDKFPNNEEGRIASEKEKGVFNQQKSDKDISNSRLNKLQMVENPNSDDGSLCAPPVASVHKVIEDNSFMSDLPLPLACEVARKDFHSPEFALSYFSCDEEEEEQEEEEEEKEKEKEVSITSFTDSTSTKCSDILEPTCATVFEKAEPNNSANNISTPSSTTEEYERKAEDMLPAFLITELNDDKAFPTDGPRSVLGSSEMKIEEPYKDDSETAIFLSETDDNAFPTDGPRSVPVLGSSEMKHEEPYKDDSETAILPSEAGSSVLNSTLADDNAVTTDQPDSVLGSSEMRHEQPYGKSEAEVFPSETDTGNTCDSGNNIDDNNMETVDLSPKVKHDDTSVCWNTNFVHSSFHQRKNLRYYKKLIKDAFTSQKRLSKEYEHLAILYGYIDMDLEPTSSPNTSVHALPSREISETEWELI